MYLDNGGVIAAGIDKAFNLSYTARTSNLIWAIVLGK